MREYVTVEVRFPDGELRQVPAVAAQPTHEQALGQYIPEAAVGWRFIQLLDGSWYAMKTYEETL